MVTKKAEIYKCSVCENLIEILHKGAGTLVCCEKEMIKMEEKISEEGNEKHKPILEKNEKGVEVKVSSIPHPMEDSHFIEWVEITTNKGTSKKFLKPGEDRYLSFIGNFSYQWRMNKQGFFSLGLSGGFAGDMQYDNLPIIAPVISYDYRF